MLLVHAALVIVVSNLPDENKKQVAPEVSLNFLLLFDSDELLIQMVGMLSVSGSVCSQSSFHVGMLSRIVKIKIIHNYYVHILIIF